VISPKQGQISDNKLHSQETDVHSLGGIRTGSSSKRPAADPRLRPRGYWNWLLYSILSVRVIPSVVCTEFPIIYTHRHICVLVATNNATMLTSYKRKLYVEWFPNESHITYTRVYIYIYIYIYIDICVCVCVCVYRSV